MKYYAVTDDPNELMHYGVKGMKWGQTFNKLKRKKIYPTINLTIIGDTINDGE